ncbi:hypothetical protein QUA70_08900 [Microcoleus sp. LAD1_D5]
MKCCTEKVRSFSAAVVSHLGLNLDVKEADRRVLIIYGSGTDFTSF